MGNIVELPNITFESLKVAEKTPSRQKTTNFDSKNYLNTRLSDGEKEKTITIRLLPIDLETGSPFAHIHVHNVKVPADMVKPGEKPYKSFICLQKTKDIDHEKFGKKCPFCELNRMAYEESKNETDPIKVKNLKEVSLANLSREAVICRCIERGKEDEGVKFWKFNIRSDKTDPYNTIIKLVELRKSAAEKKGKVDNILDLYQGRDLNITFTSEGTSAPTIVDDSDRSPLSDNEEQMKEWIYDSKKWQDVFTCKPYDYLELVSQMKTPWFDRESGCWVAKETNDEAREERVTAVSKEEATAKAEIKALEQTVAPQNADDDIPF